LDGVADVGGMSASGEAAFIRAHCVVNFAAEETARLLCGVHAIPSAGVIGEIGYLPIAEAILIDFENLETEVI